MMQGRVLWLAPTGVCRCQLGRMQRRISGGNTRKCLLHESSSAGGACRATLTSNPHSYTTSMHTDTCTEHTTQTHLCVVLIKVDKITRIASSDAYKIPRSSAPIHTQLMTQFAVTVIIVVVEWTSCHTLSAIMASNAVTSCIVDDPEVATCLALKRALHEVECTEAVNSLHRQ